MESRDWAADIAAFVAWMRTANLTPDTISIRTYQLRRAAREIRRSPWVLELEDLSDWMASHDWSPNTTRSYRCTLRAFYAWGQAVGRRADSPAHLLPTVRVPRGKPRPASEQAFSDALSQARGVVAIALRLAGHCGMRRGEIARVRREDLEQEHGGWSLRVRGKGRHVRLVPLADDLAAQIRACPPGWLFPSPTRPGPLTPAHLGKLISRMLPDGYATHTLRHRCGTVSLQATKDIRAVQELLGHASVATTMIYTEVGNDAVRDAMRAASA